MSKMDVHYSSKDMEWETPRDLFDVLNDEFGFTLDPCATSQNAKCNKFFTIEDNGLHKDWSKDVVFMNPPYGKEIPRWVEKAYNEALCGATVVCLIPARTDTSYWHKYIMLADEIRFISGRVKFTNPFHRKPMAAPFPSCIVVFGERMRNGLTSKECVKCRSI